MNTTNTHVFARIALRRTVIAAVTVACLALGTTATYAGEPAAAGERAKQVVQFGDLNLSSAKAVQVLFQRITAAARQVCNDRGNPRPVAEFDRARRCVDQSVERAVAAVNQPALSAYYAQQSGRPMPAAALVANRR